MKSKFAFTVILSLTLLLGVGSLSHAAKTTHVEKHEMISQHADLGYTPFASVSFSAITEDEINMTEYRPLVGTIVVFTKSESELAISLARKARDGLS